MVENRIDGLSLPAFACIALDTTLAKAADRSLVEKLRGVRQEMLGRLTPEQRAEVTGYYFRKMNPIFE